jgi:hypothetical protein
VRDFLDPDFYLGPESHAGAVLDEIAAAHAATGGDSIDSEGQAATQHAMEDDQ